MTWRINGTFEKALLRQCFLGVMPAAFGNENLVVFDCIHEPVFMGYAAAPEIGEIVF